MGCNDSKPKTVNNKDQIKIKSDEKKVSKEYEIKISLLGDVSVGKTSIASHFCNILFRTIFKFVVKMQNVFPHF